MPPGYQNIASHMTFSVKIGKTIIRKARFVADGHKTKTPTSTTYLSVVFRDSVWIALTIASINDLDVLS